MIDLEEPTAVADFQDFAKALPATNTPDFASATMHYIKFMGMVLSMTFFHEVIFETRGLNTH
jgi:hypothetical protein